MDHDQRFKTLIRVFFVEFLRLFFTRWITNLDLTTLHWLDKEVYPDPPEGPRHVLDLIVEVAVAATAPPTVPPTPPTLLLHVEIESPDRTTALKPRLPSYRRYLRDRYQLPVLTLVLYLQVGLEGLGVDSVVETVQGLEVEHFQYPYAGLPALEGLQYVQGDNWLGVALSALMRIPKDRVAWLGAEALRRLATAPLTDQQRFLLGECVRAYLPLDAAQKQKLEQLLQTETYAEVQAMNKTVYEEGLEKGMEKGEEKGMEKGRRAERLELVSAVCAKLEEQFGPVAVDLRTHLEQLSMKELFRLALCIPTATSLAELGLPPSAPPA